MPETISAITFTVFTGIIIIFQGCLAAGMPWGEASMRGKYPGKYPPKMRIVAIINIIILAVIAVIVLSRAGFILPQLSEISRIGIWFIVVYFSIATVLNSITPSKIERIWAPVALVQLITSIIVSIS
jgi:hypothetical protein